MQKFPGTFADEQIGNLTEVRDKLLKEIATQQKTPEKRSGYVDGVLDMFNESVKCIRRNN